MLDVSMQSNPRQFEEGKSIEQIKKRLSYTEDKNQNLTPF